MTTLRYRQPATRHAVWTDAAEALHHPVQRINSISTSRSSVAHTRSAVIIPDLLTDRQRNARAVAERQTFLPCRCSASGRQRPPAPCRTGEYPDQSSRSVLRASSSARAEVDESGDDLGGIDRRNEPATQPSRSDVGTVFLENDREQRRTVEDERSFFSPQGASFRQELIDDALPRLLELPHPDLYLSNRNRRRNKTKLSSFHPWAVTRPSSPRTIASRISRGIRTRPSGATFSDCGPRSQNAPGDAGAGTLRGSS